MTLIAVTTFGVESVVKKELIDLGFKVERMLDGRVEFEAEIKDIPQVNLWLRAAERVVVKMGEFPAADFDALFDGVKSLAWEEWIPMDGALTVTAKSIKSKLASIRANQSVVNKAMAERLCTHYGVDHLPESGPEFTVQVAIHKDVALLTMDTTGAGLHKRGYRKAAGEAPIKETLAAALVQLSFWEKDRLIIDPMCGSGTILIEAAMIGRNRAPGLQRTFLSEAWPVIPQAAWDKARHDAREAIDQTSPLQVFGSDTDLQRIKDGRRNAQKAGVGEDVIFEHKPLTDLWIDKPNGIVITNPPYGITLASKDELKPIYALFNKMFLNKKGWSVYVLTADKRFPDFFKRAQPDRVRKLFNGTISTNYYQYYGERPR